MDIKGFREVFERGQERLAVVTEEFPWEDKACYLDWIGQTYQYARRATRMLGLAGSKFPLDQNNFHYRFLTHAKEEKGHENMLRNDARALGARLEDIGELAEMSAFYKAQYYWIDHVAPVSFFGWVLCLEGLAVRKAGRFFERASQAFGVKAAEFLRVHSDEDPDHLDSAFETIAQCSADELKLVAQNYLESCALYESVLVQIMKRNGVRSKVSREVAA